jgi:hypothetical protein
MAAEHMTVIRTNVVGMRTTTKQSSMGAGDVIRRPTLGTHR